MELGNKIKTLRLRAGMTQEMLAEEMGVSFQTISKWENNICAPDVSMLPKLSVYFGVTIDELFDMTAAQRLHRIENMLDMEQELPHSTFVETEDFLLEQLEGEQEKSIIYNFLAHLYHHRMSSDSDKVDKYARKALQMNPDIQNCHWLFVKSKGAAICDWNVRNHHSVITFYKELIEKNPNATRNYLELLDNLLADNRSVEAADYLARYKKLENHKEFQIFVYEARIALCQHNIALANQKMEELEKCFPEDSGAMFELANYHASQCEYSKAIAYYEKSFEMDKQQGKKPLFTDALEGMAIIYEIQEKYAEAVKCYDRILEVLDKEFGFTEGEPVRAVMVERQRLMEKSYSTN